MIIGSLRQAAPTNSHCAIAVPSPLNHALDAGSLQGRLPARIFNLSFRLIIEGMPYASPTPSPPTPSKNFLSFLLQIH
jgi:hypothetical protein